MCPHKVLPQMSCKTKSPPIFIAGGLKSLLSALYLTLTGLRRHVAPRDDGDGDVRRKALFGYASEPAADVSIGKVLTAGSWGHYSV
jgi:hypothetical protein